MGQVLALCPGRWQTPHSLARLAGGSSVGGSAGGGVGEGEETGDGGWALILTLYNYNNIIIIHLTRFYHSVTHDTTPVKFRFHLLIFCTEFYKTPMHRIYSNVFNIHAVYFFHSWKCFWLTLAERKQSMEHIYILLRMSACLSGERASTATSDI